MAQISIPEPPPPLKTIQSYIKISNDIEKRDPIVSFWLRLYSTDTALKIDKDSPDSKKFLTNILMWLEQFKQSHRDDERVTNQTVGQAHFENYAMNIFNKADTLDRDGQFGKQVVMMFFTASVLFDSMSIFGPPSDEILQRSKYAKFKAAYIQKCLKSGLTPKPGNVENMDLEAQADNKESADSDVKTENTMPDKFTFNSSSLVPPRLSSGSSSTSPLILPETPDKDKPNQNKEYQPSDPKCNLSPHEYNGKKTTITGTKYKAMNGVPLKVDDLVKGQKYCKYAVSALQYDDVSTAVANLEKALMLLKTGQQPD